MGREDLDKVEQRVRRYWYEDGLTEIAAGCILILVGLILFLEALAPPGLLPSRVLGISISLLLTFGVWIAIWLAGRMVRVLKERFTYPRTGYVAYKRPAGSLRMVTAAIAGIIGAVTALLLRLLPDYQEWLPGFQGLVISVFLLYLAHKLGLARFYLLALFSLGIGVLISLAGLGMSPGVAAYFCLMGGALIVSGGTTLWTYLNLTQPFVGE